MISICGLPNELLEAVALHCPDTKNLRLVNRQIHEAAGHVLWRTHALNMTVNPDGLSEESVQMLVELKAGCRTSVLVRTVLIVCPGRRPRKPENTQPFDLSLLLSAIQSLKSVRTAEWDVYWDDSNVTRSRYGSILRSLGSLSLLEELIIRCDYIPVLPSDAFRGGKLKKISLKGDPSKVQGNVMSSLAQIIHSNTKLSHISIDWSRYFLPPVPTLPFSALFDPARPRALPLQTLHLTGWDFDFWHPNVIPHLKHLRSLDLSDCDYRDEVLWKMLSVQQVSLRRISVQMISNELFDYVESISGLEELHLTYFEPEDHVLSEALSERFFQHILPRHQHTLQVLGIEPDMESLDWAICYHNIHSLNSCKGLTHLTIGLGFEYEDPEHEPYDEIVARRENVMKMLILNLTSNHPKLERLTLAILYDYDDYCFEIDVLLTSVLIPPDESMIPHFEVYIKGSIYRAQITTEFSLPRGWPQKDKPEGSEAYIAFRKAT